MAVVNQYKFVGVPADVTKIDLITYVSLTKGNPEPKGVSALPVVLLSIPTNLYID